MWNLVHPRLLLDRAPCGCKRITWGNTRDIVDPHEFGARLVPAKTPLLLLAAIAGGRKEVFVHVFVRVLQIE